MDIRSGRDVSTHNQPAGQLLREISETGYVANDVLSCH